MTRSQSAGSDAMASDREVMERSMEDCVVFADGDVGLLGDRGFPEKQMRKSASDGAIGIGEFRRNGARLNELLPVDGVAIDCRKSLDAGHVRIDSRNSRMRSSLRSRLIT